MVNGHDTCCSRAQNERWIGLDEQQLCLREIRRNYRPNSRLGLRWARIYKPDHMTTLFGLVGVAPCSVRNLCCWHFVKRALVRPALLSALRKASTLAFGRAHTRLLALSSFFVKQHHITLTAHQP